MKRVVFASILALLIIGGIAFSYFYYQRYKVPRADAFGIIPKDAALVLESRNFPRFVAHLASNQLWKSTLGFAFFRRCADALEYADSISKRNPNLKSFLEQNTLFISAHIVDGDGIDFLFTSTLPQNAPESTVNEAIRDLFGSAKSDLKRSYQGCVIRQVALPDGRLFTYTIVRGLLTGSCTSFLVEDAIRQSKQNTGVQGKGFKEIYETAGKNVDANLFVKEENFAKMLTLLLNRENRGLVAPLPFFARWTGLDVKIKENNLTLSGLSSVVDTLDYLSIFKSQAPPAPTLFKHLSKKTVLLAYTAFADPRSFYSQLKAFRAMHPDSQYVSVDELNRHYETSIEKSVLDWMGNEYALAVNESGGQAWEKHAFAVIRCRDEQLAMKNLGSLSYIADRKDRPGLQQRESENYKNHSIAYLGLPDWLPALFGSDFRSFGKVFYTWVDGYVVFANQASALRSFIDDVESAKTLDRDNLFASVVQNIPSKSNRFVYVNVTRSYPMLLSFASSGLLDALQTNAQALKGIGSFAFQAIGEGDKIYTHVMLHRPSTEKKDVELLWSCKVDTTVSKKPWLVKNPKTGEQEILVQDDNNVLYFIDQNDTVVWKDTLVEPIMGEVFQVDYFHNDKYQFMFNTASAVYLIDRKGAMVKNYPHKLNPKATAGMMVFDYDRRKEYRIFIPCGHTLMAQQLNGKPIDGWKLKAKLDQIDQPVQYFRLADKDFLLLIDTVGSVHLLDRKGKDRVVFEEGMGTHIITPFCLEKGQTIEQSRLVALDNNSMLVSLYFDGRVSKESLPKSASASSFGLMDINADLRADYVYLTSNELHVESQDSLPFFVYRLKAGEGAVMQLFTKEEERGRIGVTCPSVNEVYLFNEDGSVVDGFPIKGSTGMLLIPGGEGENSTVICGSADKTINCFSIE